MNRRDFLKLFGLGAAGVAAGAAVPAAIQSHILKVKTPEQHAAVVELLKEIPQPVAFSDTSSMAQTSVTPESVKEIISEDYIFTPLPRNRLLKTKISWDGNGKIVKMSSICAGGDGLQHVEIQAFMAELEAKRHTATHELLGPIYHRENKQRAGANLGRVWIPLHNVDPMPDSPQEPDCQNGGK